MIRVLMSVVLLTVLVAFVTLGSVQPVLADVAEDKAITFVEKLGGKVVRDEKLPNKPVTSVVLSGVYPEPTDACLKELVPFKTIKTLELSLTHVTDAGLKDLAALKSLTSLGLSSTRVTDVGLKELAALKNLTDLYLASTQVTDAGMKELAVLKNLKGLSLSSTKVTDAGLRELGSLNNLSSLRDCPISRITPLTHSETRDRRFSVRDD
jgi:internalin A